MEDNLPLDSEDEETPKAIFVFLDGTKNSDKSRTNVYRLFEFINDQKDKERRVGIYIRGVGEDIRVLTGTALGRGMEDRIVEAYLFISQNYRPNDKILIFGFSRGAHQARAVAGLISFNGLLKSDFTRRAANKINESFKDVRESEYLDAWENWSHGDLPVVRKSDASGRRPETVPASVDFLGVWDTVPGSSFIRFDKCKESQSQNSLVGLLRHIPGIGKGERYKLDSYPPIRHIAHAVSIDEKRDKFKLVEVCKQWNGQALTNVHERWFPGAHSDVGGGYHKENEDSGEKTPDVDLPNFSLNWMIREMKEVYELHGDLGLKGNAAGVAHWSICDGLQNRLTSRCESRNPGFETVEIDPSYADRKKESAVRIMWGNSKKPIDLPYPIDCPKRCGDPPLAEEN